MLCIYCFPSFSGEDFNNWMTPFFAALTVGISVYALNYNRKAFKEVAKQNDLNTNFYIHQLIRKQCEEILADLSKLDLKSFKNSLPETERSKVNGLNYMECYLKYQTRFSNPLLGSNMYNNFYTEIITAKEFANINKVSIDNYRNLQKTIHEDWLEQMFLNYDRLQNILEGNYFNQLDTYQKTDILDYMEFRILVDYTNLYIYEKYPGNIELYNSHGEKVEKDENDFYMRDIDEENKVLGEIYPILETEGFWELQELMHDLRKGIKIEK